MAAAMSRWRTHLHQCQKGAIPCLCQKSTSLNALNLYMKQCLPFSLATQNFHYEYSITKTEKGEELIIEWIILSNRILSVSWCILCFPDKSLTAYVIVFDIAVSSSRLWYPSAYWISFGKLFDCSVSRTHPLSGPQFLVSQTIIFFFHYQIHCISLSGFATKLTPKC